jgi:hypothetical protein
MFYFLLVKAYNTLTLPYRCKKLICKCRNTALFLGKMSMKGIFLDATGNGVKNQCENIVLWLV